MATSTSPRAPLTTDQRLTSPILTPAGVAALEAFSASRAYDWAHNGLMTTSPAERRGWPSVPLVGLADAHLVGRMRKHRLPMEEVRAVMDTIRAAGPEGYAALSEQLVTDGVHAYVEDAGGTSRLVGGQMAFKEVLYAFKTRLLTDDEGIVYRYRVEQIEGAVIQPGINAGRMTFAETGVPVFAIAGALEHAPAVVVAHEYDIPVEHVERVAQADPDWLSLVA